MKIGRQYTILLFKQPHRRLTGLLFSHRTPNINFITPSSPEASNLSYSSLGTPFRREKKTYCPAVYNTCSGLPRDDVPYSHRRFRLYYRLMIASWGLAITSYSELFSVQLLESTIPIPLTRCEACT